MGRKPLPASFYQRPPEDVARDLVGKLLVCRGTAGVIVEAEGYHESEPACHAFRGLTNRTRPLFERAGTAYVYFTYGMHWMFNAVTGPEGEGAAALVRAVLPTEGIEVMRERRGAIDPMRRKPLADRDLCAGPGRLVQAMGITREDNFADLTAPGGIYIAQDRDLLDALGLAGEPIVAGERIGISVAVELPWRFGVADNRWLSKRFPADAPEVGRL